MTQTCDKKTACFPCNESPFENLSVEQDDDLIYWSLGHPPVGPESVPPLSGDGRWTALGCLSFCSSTVSQEEADRCAAAQSVQCTRTVGGGLTTYYNEAVGCSVVCPDGLPFTYFVPAGIYAAGSVTAANAMARSLACALVKRHKVCLGSFADYACVNEDFAGTISVSGPGGATGYNAWLIVAGSLPPGLSIASAILPAGSPLVISGTPTATGTYSFSVKVIGSGGDYMVKSYTMAVIGLTDADPLPDADVGSAYSHQLTQYGYDNPVYSLASGALPDGLTLSASGLISGTPTTAETTLFEICISES